MSQPMPDLAINGSQDSNHVYIAATGWVAMEGTT